MKAQPRWLLALLAVQAVLVSGCTTLLWDKNTFANSCRPANPSNLHLFYSNQRKDILVQYDERQDKDDQIRRRCYWLESSNAKVNRDHKPHFVSAELTNDLVPIPVNETAPNPPPSGVNGLYAVAARDDYLFTLYSGPEQLERYKLPVYKGGSQKLKQLVLTPGAVAVDATIIGATMPYYMAEDLLLHPK